MHLTLTSFALLSCLSAPPAAAPEQASARMTAVEAIRTAIVQRVGESAEVSVTLLDLPGDALVYREARPDPAARLGKPVRFTLIGVSGPATQVTATVRVVVPHLVIRQPIGRGHAVEPAAVEAVRGELTGVPIARLAAPDEGLGARTLRPLAPGDIVLRSFLALRRAIEPGDSVTVVALEGFVEVSATFLAVDGGSPGDIIRVRNPDTRKYLRGRVVRTGLVEVTHER